MTTPKVIDIELLHKQGAKSEAMAKELIIASQRTDMHYYTALTIITGLVTVTTGMMMKFTGQDLAHDISNLYQHIHDRELLSYIKDAITVSHELTSDNVTGNGLVIMAAGFSAKVYSSVRELVNNCSKLSGKHNIELKQVHADDNNKLPQRDISSTIKSSL